MAFTAPTNPPALAPWINIGICNYDAIGDNQSHVFFLDALLPDNGAHDTCLSALFHTEPIARL
jgi:hypothetical protein